METYLTVDASVYQDTVRALKKLGYIKKSTRNKRPAAGLAKAIRGTMLQGLRRIIGVSQKNDSENLKKLTVPQAQNIVLRNFREVELEKPLEKNDDGVMAIVGQMSDFGLVRGYQEPTKAAPGAEELNESLTLDRWKVLSGIK